LSVNSQLRKELLLITELPGGQSLEERARALDNLAKAYPHSIAIRGGERLSFNCIAFAFGLHLSPDYEYIATCSSEFCPNHFFAHTAFAKYILDRGELQEVSQPETGNIVIYFDSENAVKHAGSVVDQNLIRSKWGTGPVCDHPIWEVPESYGSVVRFYRTIDSWKLVNLFYDYLKGLPKFAQFRDAFDLHEILGSR
jgi:hypothetical protein